MTLTSSAGTTPGNIFDWDTTTSFIVSTTDPLVTLTYDFTNRHTYVNALRVNPYSASKPSYSFTLSGAMSASGPYTTSG